MLLKPNMNWVANQGIALPSVLAEADFSPELLTIRFTVEEPLDCFRAEVSGDNDRSWEDSCVEIFLQSPSAPAEYFNFEVTSRGFLLAAKGPDRDHRTPLSPSEMARVVRTKDLASVAGNLVCWGMTVQIPASVLGIASFEGVPLRGNLYKCADKAKTPHYLSAFEVNTEKPDFHRPEFFGNFV